ncbi:MAG: FAD-binding oxidoreductase [Christensenellaceae bacterium]|jgi:glycine/D-amino acid oxidase-like deaminating enzyme|nr:FAD-binding oxidoreductase [Christensenellaceae bacterium]
MRRQFDCIVIGGGYFGCSIAYHLSKAGKATALIEQKEIASGASGANFGCVQVQDSNMGMSLTLTLRGIERMRTMGQELQADIGFEPFGSLIVAEDAAQLQELENLYQQKKEAGLDIDWLSAAQVLRAEPNLAPKRILAATRYTQAKIYPFHYMYALVKKAREQGLTLMEHTPAASLWMEGGTCKGVILCSGEALRAEQTIVSAGSWTREFCQTAGLDVPVYSVKAEAFVTEPLKPFLNNFYSSAGFFTEAHGQEAAATSLCIHQSHHGNILIGETAKPDGRAELAYADMSSVEHCAHIHALLTRYFPALEQVQVLRSWVTRSPYTESCQPVFGPSSVEGLILAAGFKSAAILSPVVGDIVAQLVVKGKAGVDLSEFIYV